MASGDTQVVVNGTEAGSALGPQIPDASEHSGNFASLESEIADLNFPSTACCGNGPVVGMAGAEQVVLDAQDGDIHQPVRKRARCGGAVDGAIYLVENGWKVVEKARNLVLMGGYDQAVLKQYRGVVALSCMTACLLMLPMKIWDILSGIVNRNMTDADSLDSRRKPTSPEEMIGFYGVVIEWKTHTGTIRRTGRNTLEW